MKTFKAVSLLLVFVLSAGVAFAGPPSPPAPPPAPPHITGTLTVTSTVTNFPATNQRLTAYKIEDAWSDWPVSNTISLGTVSAAKTVQAVFQGIPTERY